MIAVSVLVSAIPILPVTAAPIANSLRYDLQCDLDGDGSLEFEASVLHAFGGPGWTVIEGDLSQVPAQLMGGTFTRTEETGSITFSTPPPLGLESKLTTCRIGGPIEDAGFHLVVDPAYVFFLPALETTWS
jgi:hypothetical protein